MNQITISTGHEGPIHDPYHYEEIEVEGRFGTTMIHQGLMNFVQLPGGSRVNEHELENGVAGLRGLFEKFVGITPTAAEKAFYQVKANHVRYHECGRKHLQWSEGYPGESLLWCSKCNSIIDSEFNRSAIE